MAIGSMLSRKRKPLDAATEVFNVCPERAREAVRQRFQSELVAVRRLLEKAAALPVPVPRSEEPPAKRSKEASTAPVVIARKMMAEEEDDVDIPGGASPMAIALAPPRLQPAEDKGARELVRQRFQSELVAVRRLLKKAAALPVPRSEEPPAKRNKKASTAPVVAPKMMMAEEKEEDEDEDEHVDIRGDASPEKMPKCLGDDAAISGSPSSSSSSGCDSDSDSSSDSDTDSESESVDKAEEDVEKEEEVDRCGGVSPMVIVPAPLQLAEDDDMDICGDASPVVLPKNLGVDAIISGSPSSSSSSSSSDSDSDSASDGSSSCSSNDSDDSDSDESVDGPAPAECAATPPITLPLARAKESQERQLKEARSRAREKARQEVLKTERTAMPNSERVHRTVFKSLDIKEYNMAMPENVLHQLGLFLKPDDDGDQEEQLHRQSFEEDLEEGEIRF
nr:nucleolin 2-like [Lolium perenne]